jgi:DNA-binding transcriptional ArsR family regulator
MALVSRNLPFVAANAFDSSLDPWALLGDATRRRIIERLSAAPCSVTQLADELPVSRPAVSQHLKLLKAAGVVHDEARGTRRVYSIDAARLARYRRELDAFWGSTLHQLETLTEDPTRDLPRDLTTEER